MPFFITLSIKLIPLYLNILLGYIAGKKLQANQDTIATLMFYIISPLIIFNGVLNTQLDMRIMTLPILTFVISCSLCLVFYRFSRRIWSDSSKNIMAFSAGSGATGYFGVPLAMMIFNPQIEGVYIMALLGVTLYDNSLGYYISAKGSYTPKECFYKILRLPTLYAFMLGLAFNLCQFSMPDIYLEFIGHIKGVYVVMGMMIIGLGLAGLTHFKLDVKFVGMTFLAKFLVWPLLVLLIIALDKSFFGIYDPIIHQVLILLSIVPLAVNTVIMATLVKCHPEKAAATVLLSTLFALFYVPVMTSLFIK
ncbi:AEC family transporter [Candidatus Protochlamydia phocaeensis]|uniref:AEC family transporter n=1 Tax=Candidatus Protochlamydia phocaeensis TaxID=1414722 RepID=UPI000838134D|nr:AEC family transporter [Candidatus Protochlamydia phocaeensis]